MKKITYNGTSKLKIRIAYLLNRKAPLPEDGQGEPTFGTNGQVLGTDGTGATKWVDQKSGHTILNSSGTAVADETKMQFNGLSVTDDAQNGKTVVAHDINTDAPTFSEAQTRANIASGESIATILGKIKKFFSDLKAVAFSGSYTDLTDKPTIPTVNDGTLTIQQNGTTVGTFTANQSWNTTVNLTGGGSGGHTIWNRIKTALTARGKLWFADASVSDVSTDDATKVEVVTELLNETAFDNLATDGTADGIYTFPDSGGEYLTAAMSSYDNTVSGLSASDVQDAIDELARSGGGINYSTTERVIGTWIDGSAVYEKTISLPSELEISNNNWTGTGLYVTNGDYVIDCTGINVSGGYQGSVLAYIDPGTEEIFVVTPRNSNAWIKYLTIRYTKITD